MAPISSLKNVRFAQRVFLAAGLFGVLAVFPMYFLEARIGREQPPEVTHPEFFYGFIGVTLAWQVLFLIVARDPVRLRPVMLPAVIEKATFSGAAILLYLTGRLATIVLAFGLCDLTLGILFALSWYKTAPERLLDG